MNGGAIRARRADTVATSLLIGLVMVSGNPAFSGPAVAPFLLALLAAAASFLPSLRRADGFARGAMLAAAFTCVFVTQQVSLGFVSWPASAYFLAKLLVGATSSTALAIASHRAFFVRPTTCRPAAWWATASCC